MIGVRCKASDDIPNQKIQENVDSTNDGSPNVVLPYRHGIKKYWTIIGGKAALYIVYGQIKDENVVLVDPQI